MQGDHDFRRRSKDAEQSSSDMPLTFYSTIPAVTKSDQEPFSLNQIHGSKLPG